MNRIVVMPRVRACLKTASLASTSELGENALFLVDYALRIARLIVLLSIWRVILNSHERVSGYTLASILTYTLLAEVFAEQFAPKTALDDALWQGSIATRLLQPLPLVAQIASDMVGRWLPGLVLLSLPLLCAAPLFGVHALPAGLASSLWFLVSLCLSISVGLALEFLFAGMIVLLRQSVWVIARIRNALVTVLSGSLLPLAILPWGLGDIFAFLPFASTASAPLRIYTGTGDAMPLMALQLGWSIVLWSVALGLWHMGRERLVAYGG